MTLWHLLEVVCFNFDVRRTLLKELFVFASIKAFRVTGGLFEVRACQSSLYVCLPVRCTTWNSYQPASQIQTKCDKTMNRQ
jgi:hypothetical protein